MIEVTDEMLEAVAHFRLANHVNNKHDHELINNIIKLHEADKPPVRKPITEAALNSLTAEYCHCGVCDCEIREAYKLGFREAEQHHGIGV